MTTMAINSNAVISTTTTTDQNLQQTVWIHLKSLTSKISLAYTIYNERRQLRNISDEALHDLGITRAQIDRECNRDTFDIPASRK